MTSLDDNDGFIKWFNEQANAKHRQGQEQEQQQQTQEDNEAKVQDVGNGQANRKQKGEKQGERQKEKEQEPQKITSRSQVYKLGDHYIAEAVMIGQRNTPYWITYDSLTEKLSIDPFIDITDDDSKHKQPKHLYPPKRSAYLNQPYVFDNAEQIRQLAEDVKANETPDTLFTKIKLQWKRYDSETDSFITLCCGDAFFTYFQDKLGMTHYLFFVGDNEVGKSTKLFILKYLGYRAFLGIDISTANINRFYGNEYEGIGTLLEDEVHDLDDERYKLRMYASGYTTGLKVPRSEKGSEMQIFEQEGYNTFGFKAYGAEKRPTSHRAKGFNDRTIEMPCTFGIPQYDIQEVINNAGEPKYKQLLDELNDVRNRLLLYRLIHYHKAIPDINTKLQGREKQLWKPLLRAFHNGSNTFELLEKVVIEYVEKHREQKSHTHTAFVVRLILHLIDKVEETEKKLETSVIWKEYKASLTGEETGKTTYKSSDFGDMSQKRLTELLMQQFKARRPKHSANHKELIFDKTILDNMRQKYRIKLGDSLESDESNESEADTSLDQHFKQEQEQEDTSSKIVESDESDESLCGDIALNTDTSSDIKSLKNNEEIEENSSKTEQTDTNHMQQNDDKTPGHSENPTQATQATQNRTSENLQNNDTSKGDYWGSGEWKKRLGEE